MVGEREAPWTNRIHITDLVSVCEAAMALGRDGECYNVSDGRPGNMRDYFDRVADLDGGVKAAEWIAKWTGGYGQSMLLEAVANIHEP